MVSVSPENLTELENILDQNVAYFKLGTVGGQYFDMAPLLNVPLSELIDAYENGLGSAAAQ